MKKNSFIFGILLLILLLGWFSNHLKSTELPDSKKANPERCFYFAEGSTLPNWHTYFTLFNTGGTEAEIEVTFYVNKGGSISCSYSVLPRSSTTFNALDHLEKETTFSSVVKSPQNIVAERSIFFSDNNYTGGYSLVGSTSPDTTWYLAEGTTQSGFDTNIWVMNPNDSKAKVNIDYTLDDGTSLEQKINLPAFSQDLVDTSKTVGDGQEFSTIITSDIPVVAERPIYFNYQGYRTGGFTSSGANAPASEWYFAGGTTYSGFESWVVIQNTGSGDADVSMKYITGSGNNNYQSLTIPSNSREKIFVNDFLGPGQDYSVIVSGSNPIVVERPMYFNYQDKWNGSSTSTGTLKPGTTWYFAEGRSGPGWDSYITIQNLGDSNAQVKLTNYTPSKIKKTYVSVPVNDWYQIELNPSGGSTFSSWAVASDQPVIPERSTYFDYNGQFENKNGAISWTGGDSVMGFSPDLWERFSLSGFIKDRVSGKPLKNARIKITGKSKEIIGTSKSIKSDKLGKYIFSNVPGGRYKLTVRKSGYYVHQAVVKLIRPLSLNIQLEQK